MSHCLFFLPKRDSEYISPSKTRFWLFFFIHFCLSYNQNVFPVLLFWSCYSHAWNSPVPKEYIRKSLGWHWRDWMLFLAPAFLALSPPHESAFSGCSLVCLSHLDMPQAILSLCLLWSPTPTLPLLASNYQNHSHSLRSDRVSFEPPSSPQSIIQQQVQK